MVWELKKKKLAVLTTIAVYCRLTAHRKGQTRPNLALLVAEVSPTGTDRYGICEKLIF